MDHLETAANKMILLYILNRWSGITLGQFTRLALDTRYMDYFVFVTLLDELYRDGLANRSVRKGESLRDADGQPVVRCDITPRGAEVLRTLEPRIPSHIRAYLSQATASWDKELKKENTVVATSDPDGSGGFLVRLRLNDGTRDVVDLKLSVPDRDMASSICAQWRQDTQKVYLGLLAAVSAPDAKKEEP